MNLILLTKSTTPIIGWLASLFGYVMEFIYDLTYKLLGIENIGVAIIVFTLLMNLAMIPLLLSQQRSMRINNLIQPELVNIQNKYKNKTDQKSQIRMQAETQAVYDKYGASMTGGCLTSLITLPIMLGLYRIIMNMPAYIRSFKVYFTNIAVALQSQFNYEAILEDLASANSITGDLTETNILIDLMYKFDSSEWTELTELFPEISNIISENAEKITEILSFGPINLMESPGLRISWALLIPILAGLTQWISTRMMTPKRDKSKKNEDSMSSTMNIMNNLMPLMSVFFCFTFPCYIGIYWVANSGSRVPIQYVINRVVNSEDVNVIISKNIAKKNKKRARKGQPPLSEKTVDKNIEELEKRYQVQNQAVEAREKQHAVSSGNRNVPDAGKQVNSTEYYNSRQAKPGSLSAKANMVKDYDDRQQQNRQQKKK